MNVSFDITVARLCAQAQNAIASGDIPAARAIRQLLADAYAGETYRTGHVNTTYGRALVTIESALERIGLT
jgi:hypothetical protein